MLVKPFASLLDPIKDLTNTKIFYKFNVNTYYIPSALNEHYIFYNIDKHTKITRNLKMCMIKLSNTYNNENLEVEGFLYSFSVPFKSLTDDTQPIFYALDTNENTDFISRYTNLQNRLSSINCNSINHLEIEKYSFSKMSDDDIITKILKLFNDSKNSYIYLRPDYYKFGKSFDIVLSDFKIKYDCKIISIKENDKRNKLEVLINGTKVIIENGINEKTLKKSHVDVLIQNYKNELFYVIL